MSYMIFRLDTDNFLKFGYFVMEFYSFSEGADTL